MNRSQPASTHVLRTTLRWTALGSAVLAVAGAVVGYLVAGWPGVWSALVAIVLAAVFLGMTGASIVIANRWYGDPLFTPIFFGAVMGGWIVKFVLFIVALFVLRDQPWLQPGVFAVALILSVLLSLVIDVVVMTRMRLPNVSDVSLPTAADVDEAERGAAGPSGTPRPHSGDGATSQE
ncbi:hypothetical protein [Microbacterium sp. No. 7]|uniref:hypothetical protein n=1 Tax=Microbacterium sp. No. 7 TaxID=1714373 RepID=UPI0006D0D769|nr:hypothetical protein [Microbacterium sp. No. 7]ALJ21167.1 hypothetical protein AOA12_15150 [Microbacterium sp. No. 7]